MIRDKIAQVCFAATLALGVFGASLLGGTSCTKQKSDFQKDSLEVMAEKTLNAWANGKDETLKAFVHPKKGVRFSPYSFVNVRDDVVLKADQMADFFADGREALYWGVRDGSGDPIVLAPAAYYEDFIYPVDFKASGRMNVNKIEGKGSSLENTATAYPGASVVEFYYPGTSEYGEMDWRSLRFVYEKDGDMWYLVGVVSNSWTT